jgi:hypothetical protein
VYVLTTCTVNLRPESKVKASIYASARHEAAASSSKRESGPDSAGLGGSPTCRLTVPETMTLSRHDA